MAITTGTGIPFRVIAGLAFGFVIAEITHAAMGQKVELRILLLAQSSGPEVAPLAKNTVDGRFDDVYMNSVSALLQDMNSPFSFANSSIPPMVLNP